MTDLKQQLSELRRCTLVWFYKRRLYIKKTVAKTLLLFLLFQMANIISKWQENFFYHGVGHHIISTITFTVPDRIVRKEKANYNLLKKY